jgi:putative redox protein
MLKVTARYEGSKRFTSDEGARRVVMDGSVEHGGRGEAPGPKDLVLLGLAGCTGIDVTHMLERQGVRFADFVIDVEADQTEAHPRVFTRIRLVYRLRAAEADRPTIARAIELSATRYCGVSAMLDKTAVISRVLELAPL